MRRRGRCRTSSGLDGAWVSDFAKQGAIADLSALMDDAKYDQSQLASQVKVDDKTYMIPVVNFIYPMFTNDDLLKKAGVTKPPPPAPSSLLRPRRSASWTTNTRAGSCHCRLKLPMASRTT